MADVTFTPDQQAAINAAAKAGLASGQTFQPGVAGGGSSASYRVDGNALVRNLDGSTTPVSASQWATRQPDGSYVVDGNTRFATQDGQTVTAAQYGYATPVGTTSQQTSPTAATGSQGASDASSAALLLKQYGLDELIPVVDQWIRGGMSWEEAQLALYDRSTTPGKIFAARFPAIQMRQDKGLSPITPAQYVAFEEQAQQIMRASGLPAGFYDSKADFTNLIANDVSVPELQARITNGYVAAAQAPPDVKAELAAYYGVDEGSLAAHFLDPTVALPLIQKQVAAAKLGAASSRVGLNFGVGESEHLYDAGVSEAQAAPLFAKVAGEMPLLGDLQKRFNDPNDPLTADQYTNALVIQDPQQLQHVARLLAQNQSSFSPSELYKADPNTGGIPGMTVS